MHAQNFFVSTALAPKTSGEQKGLLYEAHDYPAHGRIVATGYYLFKKESSRGNL